MDNRKGFLKILKEHDIIEYIGKDEKFRGKYLIMLAHKTYKYIDDCPEEFFGKLLIGNPLENGSIEFYLLEDLNPSEWIPNGIKFLKN